MCIPLVINKILDGIKVELHGLLVVKERTQVFRLHVELGDLFSLGIKLRFVFCLQSFMFFGEFGSLIIKLSDSLRLIDDPFLLQFFVIYTFLGLVFTNFLDADVRILNIVILFSLFLVQHGGVILITTINVL